MESCVRETLCRELVWRAPLKLLTFFGLLDSDFRSLLLGKHGAHNALWRAVSQQL